MDKEILPQRPVRRFMPHDFQLSTWALLEPYFHELLGRELNAASDWKQWLKDRSELESIISEEAGWRYIRMTCFTENEEYQKKYQRFVEEIQPEIAPVSDQLNKRLIDCPYLSEFDKEEGYQIMIRNLRKEIEIFREKNIPLFTQINTKTQKYGQLSGAMTIEVQGKEVTLQQAAVFLMSTNRTTREEVYAKITVRRLKDKEVFDSLFSELVQLRSQVAKNADFENFRDYMFKAYGRFDYTPSDCFQFHDSVQSEIVPILNELALRRKKNLGVDVLRPWDKAVNEHSKEALKAFEDGKDLTSKAIECFTRLDPFLGQCLSIMDEMGHLDLESRKGKAPGGYNYPLAEIGIPFIFMNATSTLRDLTTIMHEGGHAVHNFLTKDLELGDFKSPPMEVAELASMAMELISMDHWDVFFEDEDALARAKAEHLEDILGTLPWVATIDKFQHWIYENPSHTEEERITNWVSIMELFSDSVTDWTGQETAKGYLWQKQLHLYEVPFYYIEYGMAQLGAIAVWRNYKEDKQKGLAGYMNALKLGNMKSIPEIYQAAGIEFNFSKKYIKELTDFVKGELTA